MYPTVEILSRRQVDWANYWSEIGSQLMNYFLPSPNAKSGLPEDSIVFFSP